MKSCTRHVPHRDDCCAEVNFRLLCVATATFAMIVSVSACRASSVALAFNARINTVAVGIPFESGIDFQTGDTISGRFSFDPVVGDGGMYLAVQQPHALSIRIHGAEFATANLEFQSVNNAPTADFPPASVLDILEFGAGGLTAANPAAFPNLDPSQSSFRMTLFGPHITFSGASVPASMSDWNALNLWRQLNVGFRDGKGGAVGFQATVGNFVVVPEPTSLLVALVFGSSIAIKRYRPQKR